MLITLSHEELGLGVDKIAEIINNYNFKELALLFDEISYTFNYEYDRPYIESMCSNLSDKSKWLIEQMYKHTRSK